MDSDAMHNELHYWHSAPETTRMIKSNNVMNGACDKHWREYRKNVWVWVREPEGERQL